MTLDRWTSTAAEGGRRTELKLKTLQSENVKNERVLFRKIGAARACLCLNEAEGSESQLKRCLLDSTSQVNMSADLPNPPSGGTRAAKRLQDAWGFNMGCVGCKKTKHASCHCRYI